MTSHYCDATLGLPSLRFPASPQRIVWEALDAFQMTMLQRSIETAGLPSHITRSPTGFP